MKILWLGKEQKLADNYTPPEHEFLIMNRENFSMEKLKEFNPDVVIEREFNDAVSIYEYEWSYIKREMPHIKRAMWFIDTHVQFQRHLAYAAHFDFIFLAISRYVPIFQNQFPKAKVFWLPLCHPVTCLPPNSFGRDIKASFVGRWGQTIYPERTVIVEELKQEKWFQAVTDYNNVYQIMSNSIISFNRSYSEDMNFRVFEALACGTELVTNEVPDILKIKGLKNRIHLYKRDGDAVKMVSDLVNGKRKFKSDAQSHRKYIMSFHLLKHRVTELLCMLQYGAQHDY